MTELAIDDLDFDLIEAEVVQATDTKRRTSKIPLIANELELVKSRADAVAMLRNHIVIAASKGGGAAAIGRPIVRAFVRVHHHPLSAPLPSLARLPDSGGVDRAPLLTEVARENRDLVWNVDVTKALLLDAILEHGDHVLDAARDAWELQWDVAAPAAMALMMLITLRELGDLAFDEAELRALGASGISVTDGTLRVQMTAADWITNAEALASIARVTALWLEGGAGRLREVVASPHFARVESLSLYANLVTDDDVRALAASPHARGLRDIDLTRNHLTNAGVEALAASENLKALVACNLASSRCDDPVDANVSRDANYPIWQPTDFGAALEAKYGRIAWLHPAGA
jgi:hypothetical protein